MAQPRTVPRCAVQTLPSDPPRGPERAVGSRYRELNRARRNSPVRPRAPAPTFQSKGITRAKALTPNLCKTSRESRLSMGSGRWPSRSTTIPSSAVLIITGRTLPESLAHPRVTQGSGVESPFPCHGSVHKNWRAAKATVLMWCDALDRYAPTHPIARRNNMHGKVVNGSIGAGLP